MADPRTQLQLDVTHRQAAPIENRLIVELDHLRRNPPDPADRPNADAHHALIHGTTVLLDWLAVTDPLPADPLAWPCSACLAGPGQPCDIPGRRDSWTPPGPRYHLDRGLHGRWSDLARTTHA